MNLMTKLGVVTLAMISVAPLEAQINPTIAQAKKVKQVGKKKIYKISKNVLKSKKNVVYKNEGMGLGIILEQYKPNKLRIIDSLMNWSQVHDYKITKQTVKGNTMALKLTTKGVKGNGKGFVKGKGTIRLIRTGKNSYMIPKIYQLKSNETRINRKIVKSAVNMDKAEKPKAKAIKGFRTATIKSLKSRNNLMHYGMSLSAYK